MTVEHDARVQGTHLDRAQRERLRDALTEQRAALRDRLGVGRDGVAEADESAADDALARAAGLLEDVEAALHRLDTSTYGLCGSCGDAIPFERLEAVPTAPRCVRCQTRAATFLS